MDVPMTEQETIKETRKHINNVMNCIFIVIQELLERAKTHDDSKLCSPELETFMKYTPKLATSTYGSDEYKQFLAEMKPALDHHYECNRHHPEHFKTWVCSMCHQGHREKPMRCAKCGSYFPDADPEIILKPDVSQMNLVDIIEMLCDWKAATMRHNDGDILKSIEFNKKRFQISDQLTQIFLNTVSLFEKKGEKLEEPLPR